MESQEQTEEELVESLYASNQDLSAKLKVAENKVLNQRTIIQRYQSLYIKLNKIIEEFNAVDECQLKEGLPACDG